jgi:FAD/FMN-containing dehydrogenase
VYDAVSRRAFLARGARLAVAAAALPAFVPFGSADAAIDSRVRALARRTKGRVLARGTAGYDNARLLYNTRFDDIFPLAVLEAAGPEDVRQAVLWSQRTGVRLAARSGGHSYGGYSSANGGLIVDLGALAGVRVNRSAGTAFVGPGARLINVYAALAQRGLTIPGGSCPTVCIGGLALGGGVGLAGRKFGTTSDNIRAVQLVTADGRLVTAAPGRNPDLLWACRGGGGGNFGIVTSFLFDTHPVSSGSWFSYSFPWAAAHDVIRAWQRWAPEGPDELYSICSVSTGSGSPSVAVFGQYTGPQAALERELRELTRAATPSSTSIGFAAWLDLMMRWAGCLGKSLAACQPKGDGSGTLGRSTFKAKSDYVNRPFNANGLETVTSWIERRQAQGESGVLLMDAYGGALNRVRPGATAFVHRNAICSLQYYVGWGQDAQEASALAWIAGFYRAMRPFVSGFAYQNYIDPSLPNWQHAYYGTNLPRLQAVKRKHDPENLFRFRQSIRPR